jgi:hypothetical protein
MSHIFRVGGETNWKHILSLSYVKTTGVGHLHTINFVHQPCSAFDQTLLLNLLQNTQSSPKFTDIFILIIYLPLGKKLEISLCHLAVRGRPHFANATIS